MTPASYGCTECPGAFPTEAELAQHLNEHELLRQLRAETAMRDTTRRPSLLPLVSKPPAPAAPDRGAVARGPIQAARGPTSAMAMKSATVGFFDEQKGFGFLRRSGPDARAGQVFFHIKNCDIKKPSPVVGESVTYCEEIGPKGPVASSVVRPSPPPAPASGGSEHATTNTKLPSVQHEAAPTVDVSSAGIEPTEHLLPAALELGPVKQKFKQLARATSVFKGRANPRFVYVDLDNIFVTFVTADHLVGLFPMASTTHDLQLDLQGLTRRLAEGAIGNGPARLIAFYFNTPEAIAAKLRTLSYAGVTWDVRKQETTSDTSMQLELLNAKQPCSAHPKTLVLVTGDGNIAPNGMCFREIMDKYLRDGWAVEIHAWMCSMAFSYINFQEEYPSQVWIRPLDDERVGEVVRVRARARARGQGSPVLAAAKPAKPTTGKQAGSRATKQANRSPLKPNSSKHVPEGWKTTTHEPKPAVADNDDEEKRAVALDTNEDDEEKRAVVSDTDEDDDDDDDELFQFFDRRAFTVALMAAVEGKLAAPTTTPSTASYGIPEAALPVSSVATKRTYHPEQYKTLIDQIEGPDGELFIPTAIAMLKNSDRVTDLSSIQEADVETQRVLLAMALTDEMDTATWRFIHADDAEA